MAGGEEPARAVRPPGGARPARGRAQRPARRRSPRCSAASSPTQAAKVMHHVEHRRGARLRGPRALRGAGRPRHHLSRPLPPHQGQAAVRALRPRAGDGRRPPGPAPRAGRPVPPGLRGLLRALQAARLAEDARPLPGAGAHPRPGALVLPPRQGHRPLRLRVLRPDHPRDALGGGRRRLRAHRRAGGLRHRVLDPRGEEAPAPAEAQEPRRPGGPHHGRRGGHRQRHRAAAPGRGGERRPPRHRSRGGRRRPAASLQKDFGADRVRAVACNVTDEGQVCSPSRPRSSSTAESTSW